MWYKKNSRVYRPLKHATTADKMNAEVDEKFAYQTLFIGVSPHDSRTLIVETYSVNRLRNGPIY